MSESEPDYSVDIPITVPPEMAHDILAEIEATGEVTIGLREDNAENLTDQIRWQLENEQPLLTFVEEYDA